MREVALEKIKEPIASSSTRSTQRGRLPFNTDEFFAAMRECFNRRVHDEAYLRLAFCLLGVAVPSDLINSPTIDPFQHRRAYLAKRLYPGRSRVARGGPCRRLPASEHCPAPARSGVLLDERPPYLTQSLCAAVAADPRIQTSDGVDDLSARDLFEPKARETNINLADVANRALHAGDLEEDPEKFRADLLQAYEKAWKGKPLADDESNRVAALLKLSGIMRSEDNQLGSC